MNDTLALIKGTTAESLENVTPTFDDLPTPIYRGTRPKAMSRIVDATAAERSEAAKAQARRRPAVMVTEARDVPQSTPVDASGDNPFPASAAQLDHITRVLGWLSEVDPDGAADMTAWLDRGNRDNLTGGRGGSASDLITRIKDRIQAKKTEVQVATPDYAGQPSFVVESPPTIPNGYYALPGDGDVIHFYRVKAGRNAGWTFVDAMASDVRHPIRSRATKDRILRDIEAMGTKESSQLYGQHIGSCGRCHRTLTDAESRARGIGPDCWGKM